MPKDTKPAEQATPETESLGDKSAADEMEDLISEAAAYSDGDSPTTPEADASIPDDVGDLTEETLSKLPRGLQERFRSLTAKEEKLEALQRELESLTEDAPEVSTNGKIKVPEGWEAIQPIIDQLQEKQDRLEQERGSLRKELNDARANIELRSFQSDHTDWKQYEKKMVDMAQETGFEVHDRSSLDILYKMVKNQEAATRLEALERDREIGKKAGASPRFQGSTRTGVREQLAEPSGKKTFDEAANWALKQMAAGRRTR